MKLLPEFKWRKPVVFGALLLVAVFFSVIFLQPKPKVRFVRFQTIHWSSSPDQIVPIFSIVNQTWFPFNYIAEGEPSFAVQVVETEGNVPVPRKYLLKGEYCTGVPVQTIQPGERREIAGKFFGVGERAFRTGVQIWPQATEDFQERLNGSLARELLALWQTGIMKVAPERYLSWSDWVVLPEDLRAIHQADLSVMTFEPNRIWPPKE